MRLWTSMRAIRPALVMAALSVATIAYSSTMSNVLLVTSGHTQARSLFPSDFEARCAGPGHPWQGGPSTVNPFSFAKQTEIPLLSWKARGGLPVGFGLHHCSQGFLSNLSIGPKWLHSYDITLLINVKVTPQKAAIIWGSQLIQLFSRSGSNWIPMDGYRSTLAANGNGFRLTLKHQTKLEFQLSNGSTNLVRRYRLASMTDPNGNTITFQYNGLGLLSTLTDPSGRTLTLGYVSGKLDTVTFGVGAYSRVWHFAYDTLGRLIRVDWPTVTTSSGPTAYSVQLAYTPAGNNVSQLIDCEGYAWLYNYLGNTLASEQWPANTGSELVLYSAPSQSLRRVTDPRGVATEYEYDGLSRLVRIRDANSNDSTLQYNDPDYVWRPSRLMKPSGTTYSWDWTTTGNMGRFTSPWNQNWDFSYDARNNLRSILEPLVTNAYGVTDPSRHRTEYDFDASNNLTTVRQYNSPTTFYTSSIVYDAFGQPTSTIDSRGKITQYQYDSNGNMTRLESPMHRIVQWVFTDPNQTRGFTLPQAQIDGLGSQTNFVRDEWGRLLTRDFPSGTDVEYRYDGRDRLIRMQDVNGLTTFGYNPNGWLTHTHNVMGGSDIDNVLLPNGLRSQRVLSTPFGSSTTNFYYDTRNQLSSMDEGGSITAFSYDVDGRTLMRSLGNGASSNYSYSLGLLNTITHTDSTSLNSFSFSHNYQENGLLKSVVENSGAITKTAYDYLNRLIQEDRTVVSSYSFDWAYDSIGNRALQHKNGVLTTYNYDDDNRLQQSVTQGQQPELYNWNSNGQLTDRLRQNGVERFHFTYDYEGQVSSMTEWNGSTYQPFANYNNDGLGRRTRRERFVGGLPDTYVDMTSDGGGWTSLFEHRVVQGQPTSVFMNWAMGLINTHETAGANARWSATDGFGNMRRILDQNGQFGGYFSVFNRFGEVMSSQGTSSAYAFSADRGARSEGDAGLIYYNGHAGLGANFTTGMNGTDQIWAGTGAWPGYYDSRIGLRLPDGVMGFVPLTGTGWGGDGCDAIGLRFNAPPTPFPAGGDDDRSWWERAVDWAREPIHMGPELPPGWGEPPGPLVGAGPLLPGQEYAPPPSRPDDDAGIRPLPMTPLGAAVDILKDECREGGSLWRFNKWLGVWDDLNAIFKKR